MSIMRCAVDHTSFILIYILLYLSSTALCYECPFSSSPSPMNVCGCYSTVMVRRPECARSELIFWCSDDLDCSNYGELDGQTSCKGKVYLGSFAYCSSFITYGKIMSIFYGNCNDKFEKNKAIQWFLGDTESYMYNENYEIALSDIAEESDYFSVVKRTASVSGAAAAAGLGINSNDNKKFNMDNIYSKFKVMTYDNQTVYLTADNKDCVELSWHTLGLEGAFDDAYVFDRSSQFSNGCNCKRIRPLLQKTNQPTSAPVGLDSLLYDPSTDIVLGVVIPIVLISMIICIYINWGKNWMMIKLLNKNTPLIQQQQKGLNPKQMSLDNVPKQNLVYLSIPDPDLLASVRQIKALINQKLLDHHHINQLITSENLTKIEDIRDNLAKSESLIVVLHRSLPINSFKLMELFLAVELKIQIYLIYVSNTGYEFNRTREILVKLMLGDKRVLKLSREIEKMGYEPRSVGKCLFDHVPNMMTIRYNVDETENVNKEKMSKLIDHIINMVFDASIASKIVYAELDMMRLAESASVSSSKMSLDLGSMQDSVVKSDGSESGIELSQYRDKSKQFDIEDGEEMKMKSSGDQDDNTSDGNQTNKDYTLSLSESPGLEYSIVHT